MESSLYNSFLKKISGVVVWYNPKDEHVLNILSYIDWIDKLYIFDNSSKNNESFLKKIEKYKEKIEYISFLENKGISEALNYAGEKALKENYKWLLTMDQDSKFEKETFIDYYKYLSEKNTAIISPNYIYTGKEVSVNRKFEFEELKRVITSGNLLNLEIFEILNGFDNKLFIDEVDHEYCYRVIERNYRILKINSVFLEHSLGETKIKKILGIKVKYTEHSPIRKYYIWRNRIFVGQKYSNIKKEYINFLIKDFLKIVFFEENKILKLKMVILGIKDYKKNIFGVKK